jgi:hypothetical protein
MGKVAYTLKQKNGTEELHLFEGEFTESDKCTSGLMSVCEMMAKADSSGNIFACLDENDARLECAKLGRKVCGVCVSHLYTTYDN